jgi:hypothetical protein
VTTPQGAAPARKTIVNKRLCEFLRDEMAELQLNAALAVAG